MPGEHEIVLRAFERVRTLAGNPLLILAPRKPEHFAEAEALAARGGLPDGAPDRLADRRGDQGRRRRP